MPLIRVPFADSGDKTPVPIESQSDGSVSFVQGYPLAYSLNPETDAAAKRIERAKMNQLFNDITTAIREMQINGVKPYITSDENGESAFSYGLGALVIYNGIVYRSLVAANTQLPTVTANWSPLVTASDNPGRLINIQVITASGNYVPTAGAKTARAFITGAGGGGAGCQGNSTSQTISGSGGGAGGTAIKKFTISAASYSVVVGTGGTGGVGAVSGGNGGLSSLNGAVGNGGIGGARLTATSWPGGSGGTATGGDINARGGYGTDGQAATVNFIGYGNGGASYWGGGGRAGNGGGATAAAYGSGGGGSYDASMSGTAYTGGAGANGVVIVEEYS